MVERVGQGWTLAQTAEAAGVSVRTVSKWLACHRVEGEQGLLDHSSAPGSIPHRTPDEQGAGDRGVAAPADDRGGDRRVPADAVVDGLGGPDPDRAREALTARAA